MKTQTSPAQWVAVRNLFSPSRAVWGADSYFLEPFPAADPVSICGAGHIARPTCQIAAMADFRGIVLDDRAEFASPERFPLGEVPEHWEVYALTSGQRKSHRSDHVLPELILFVCH